MRVTMQPITQDQHVTNFLTFPKLYVQLYVISFKIVKAIIKPRTRP